jgi:Na+/H+-dicarboxylate symporter
MDMITQFFIGLLLGLLVGIAMYLLRKANEK